MSRGMLLAVLAVVGGVTLVALVKPDIVRRLTVGRVADPRKKGATLPVVSIPAELRNFMEG